MGFRAESSRAWLFAVQGERGCQFAPQGHAPHLQSEMDFVVKILGAEV
jgi:hypothetical protein